MIGSKVLRITYCKKQFQTKLNRDLCHISSITFDIYGMLRNLLNLFFTRIYSPERKKISIAFSPQGCIQFSSSLLVVSLQNPKIFVLFRGWGPTFLFFKFIQILSIYCTCIYMLISRRKQCRKKNLLGLKHWRN